MNLTVGIFGSQELAAKLGKKGTTNDIALYNHASSEGIFTYACPNSEKIQPLLQVLNIIDIPVLVINEMSKEIGEVIIGIDQMNFAKGFIITQMRDELQNFIKGTSLEKFEFIEESELWPKLIETKVQRPAEPLLIPIDNYFNVKGVGTVVLGIVKSGKVSVHDKLLVEPSGKEIIVKGIQSNDKDITEALAGTRVGLSLRGIDADELKRGYVVCRQIEKTDHLKLDFAKNRFFKQELKKDSAVLLSVGLQVVSCIVEETNGSLVLKSNQTIVYAKGQRCIVASQNDIMPRIIGSGAIESL